MADTPPPENSPEKNSTESPPGSPPPSSPPPAASPPQSPPPSSPRPESPPPSSPPPESPPPSSPPPPPSSSSPPQSVPETQTPPLSSPPPSSSNSSPPPSQSTSPSPPPPSDSNSRNHSPPAPSTPNNSNNHNGGESPGVWKAPPVQPTPRTSANDRPAALSPPGETLGRSSDGSSPSISNSSGSIVSVPLITAVAVVAGIVLLAFLLLFLICRRKRREIQMEERQYYRDHNHANQGGGRQGPNWQNTNEMMNNIPPPPAGWGVPPPPPPVDLTSTIFSGQQGFAVLPPPPPPVVALPFNNNQSNFTYDELVVATSGFSQANLLGQGGFGFVHKGVLPNGKEVAVKSLKAGSGQGESEFKAEVEIISRVHHRHLVSLVGYCIAEDKRLLVNEFVPNNNLEFHLHGKNRPTMDFPTRLKIALGSAKGLAYLHEDCHPRIIHRDIKSSNILLDSSGEVKVSDFGLAKLNSENYTHVSTRVMGTFGYLAPEYASSGKLTDKSDTFSFGVMLLELISGRRPVDPTGTMEDSLVDWARPLCLRALEDGNFDEIADPFLEKNFPAHEMARMVACASASIRHSAKRRPKMSQIVRALEGDASLEDLTDNGAKVANNLQFGGSSTAVVGSNTSETEYNLTSYADDMKRLQKIAVDSGPYPSSEYGATSEYGINLSSSSSENASRNESPRARPIPK
ncbi:hypothetical protein ACOSQ3_005636 [Xanthoceras sorbifolium]